MAELWAGKRTGCRNVTRGWLHKRETQDQHRLWRLCPKLRFTGNLVGPAQEGNTLLFPGQVVIWELRSTLLNLGRCSTVKIGEATRYETSWCLQKQSLTEVARVPERGSCTAEELSNSVGGVVTLIPWPL